MSGLDDVLAAGSTALKGAPPSPPQDGLADVLAAGSVAKPTPESPVTNNASPSWFNSNTIEGRAARGFTGLAEGAANYATGLYGTIAGGISGAADLAIQRVRTGEWHPDWAAKTSEDVRNALTYVPRTDVGAAGAALPNRALEAATNVEKSAFPSEAPIVTHPGEVLGEWGNERAGPLAGALLSAAPSALGVALGARKPTEGTAPIERPGVSNPAPEVARPVPNGPDMGGRVTPAPSLAQTTPETQAAVAQVAQSGGIQNPAALGRITEADSLPVPIKLTTGQATQDVRLMSHELNTRGAIPGMAERFNDQNTQLVQNLGAIRNNAAEGVTATSAPDVGQGIIDSYLRKDAPIAADIRAKYKALEDANGGAMPVAGTDFVSAADAALAKNMKTRYVPPEIRGVMDDVKSSENMTFEQFETLRTDLAAAQRKANRAGDGNASMAIGTVRDSLESLPMTGGTAELKALADQARSAAKARFDAMRADPAYDAAVNGTVDPDKFVQKFVIGGSRSDVAAMRANLDSLGQQHMAAGAMDYLSQRAGVLNGQGNFSQAGFNRAIYGQNGLAPKLTQIFDPQTAQHVESLANVSRYTQAQPRGSFVNNSNTLVGHLAENAKNSAEGAANVFAGGVPVGTWARKAIEKIQVNRQAKKSLNLAEALKMKQ